MSTILAVENATIEIDSALRKLRAVQDKAEAMDKKYKTDVDRINKRYRDQIKKLKKEIKYWQIAMSALFIASVIIAYL